MNKDERFIFRADPPTRTRLEQLAEDHEMSMSEVIRYLIEKEWSILNIPKGIKIK